MSDKPFALTKITNGEGKKAELVAEALVYNGLSETRAIPTGSLNLDFVFGCGGIPLNAMTQLSGPSDSGKTTLARIIGASAISQKIKTVVFTTEAGRWNVMHAYKSGMGKPGEDYDLIIPGTQEKFFNMALLFAKRGYGLMILDSIASLAPSVDVEQAEWDNTKAVGKRALLWDLFFQTKWYHIVAEGNIALLAINQERENFKQAATMGGYQPPPVLPGGKAIEFNTSVGITCMKPGKEQREYGERPEDGLIGLTIRARNWKNHMSFPHRQRDIHVRYVNGTEVNICAEVVDWGKQFGIFKTKEGNPIVTTGTWHYKDTVLGTSRDAVNAFLMREENRSLFEELYALVYDGVSKL